MPLDSSAIGNAIVAKLGADAALLAIATNGVYYGAPSEKATAFVVVTLVTEDDEPALGKRAFEDHLYLVEARILGNTGGAAAAAAARIDALLDPQPPDPPATLVVAGYALMISEREEFVRFEERDDVDTSKFWFRRGGHYRVMMST
jgi:hypothetical protein